MDGRVKPMNGLFGKLFARLFGASAANSGEGQPPRRTLAMTEKEFGETLQKVRAQLEEATRPEAVFYRQQAELERERRRVAEEWHRKARSSVEQLHRKLKTGLEGELERLSRLMHGHAWTEKPNSTLEEQIEHSVLARIYWETGQLAWTELTERMAFAKLDWPQPADAYPNPTEQERQLAVQRARREAHGQFLRYPPPALADLVLGKVPSWRSVYPAVGSPLWEELCLLAVAAAFRIQAFGKTLEAWLWRPPELEERLVTILDGELGEVREMVARGGLTLAEADLVSQRARQVCAQVIPDEVWTWIAPQLHAPLGEPQGVEDPVCGMRFPVEQAVESCTREGTQYWFCSKGCKEKFLARF